MKRKMDFLHMNLWEATIGVYLVVLVVAFLKNFIPVEEAFLLEVLLIGSAWLGAKIQGSRDALETRHLVVLAIFLVPPLLLAGSPGGDVGGTIVFGYLYGIFHADKYLQLKNQKPIMKD